MPDIKFSQFPEATILNGEEEVVGLQGGLNTRLSLDLIKDFVNTQPINALTLQGTTIGTTARAIYGFNVISASSDTNFCTRLPIEPIEGKTVTFINESTRSARVYPSLTGGKINGVVDGFFDVPNDSIPYTFICYENPVPGYWGVRPAPLPLTNSMVFQDITLAHTVGTSNYGYGIGGSPASSAGGALSWNATIGAYVLVLTPSAQWKSLDVKARLTKLKVYTNIIKDDCASEFMPDSINTWITTCYQNASNGGTTGQRATVTFASDAPGYFETQKVNGGTFNTPIEIGDIGTFYGELINFGDLPQDQLGLGGEFSRYYFIFGMEIPATAKTKDYKFRFEIEYI